MSTISLPNTESDNFETTFKSLVTIMDTDLEWVKAHTRLIQRAVEWDKNNRSDSFVLRGEDLSAAEQMLGQTEKEPKLTDLQAAYILASRQSAIKRQRITTAAVTVALVVAVLLTIAAFYQQRRAVAGEQRAKESEAIAISAEETAVAERDLAAAAQARAEDQARQTRANQSRLLAARAESILDQRLRSRDLALLLAREAVQTTWASDNVVVPEAETVLRRALDELWRVTLDHGYTGDPTVGVEVNALSPNGKTVVIQPYPINNNLLTLPTIWDTTTGKLIAGSVDDRFVGFSQDGTRLVASFFVDDTALSVRDATTGNLISEITGQFKTLNYDGTRLVTDDGSGLLSQVWDTSAGTLLSELPGEFKALSQDGTKLVSVDDSGLLNQVWDTSTGTLLGEFPGEFKAISQDGTKLVSVDASGPLSQVWDTSSGTLISEWPGMFSAFSQDGTKIITFSDNQGGVWDTSTNVVAEDKAVPLYTFNPAESFCSQFSGDGTKLVRFPTAAVPPCAGNFMIDLMGAENIDLCNFVAMSNDGTKIIDENQGAYTLWDATTRNAITLPGKFLQLSPNGETLVIDGGFNALLMLDTTTNLQTPPTTTEKLLEAATNRILRDTPEFTPEERAEFGLN